MNDPISPTPHVIGLTGSIGMGKSTVAAMFARAGVPVFDADHAVREMQGPDGSLVSAIETAFPGSTGPEGVLREKLGAQVFADPAALARLEGIIHPAVAEARAEFLAANFSAPLVVFDIPLLFEKGGSDQVDSVIVVSAPTTIQRARVLARPGMTEGKFAHILGLQTPDAQKRARADYVIDTAATLEQTEQAVSGLIDQLMTKPTDNRAPLTT